MILEVGTEGGSIKVTRQRTGRGKWAYLARSVDHSESVLDEDAEPSRSESEPFESLEQALGWMDQYPWARLHPVTVHSSFRKEILEAVRERLEAARRPEHLSEWQRRTQDDELRSS